ncbi:hypothetical protein BN1708_011017 [Verticillium longisporum]|uniref:Uncharacterized protein n=1 Tax=Verticillium longisporum TaxID=100787 RepID=A0A0G4KW54_VERLO|nr:hypothetical protein BN1708_011017 [Verticillium longisporum]
MARVLLHVGFPPAAKLRYPSDPLNPYAALCGRQSANHAQGPVGAAAMQLGGRIRRMNLLHLAPVAHSTRVYIGLAVDFRSRVGGNRGLGSGNLRVWVFGTACRTRVIAFAFVANPQLLYLSTAGRSHLFLGKSYLESSEPRTRESL